jgi:signal transduction histidine kinase
MDIHKVRKNMLKKRGYIVIIMLILFGVNTLGTMPVKTGISYTLTFADNENLIEKLDSIHLATLKNDSLPHRVIERFEKTAISLNDKNAISSIFLIKANFDYSAKNYKRALENYHNALFNFASINNKTATAVTLCKIAELYETIGEFNQSIEFMKDAISLFKEAGEKSMQAYSIQNLADTYYEIEFYHSAKQAYGEALLKMQYPALEVNKAYIHTQLGIIAIEDSMMSEAREWFNQALKIYQQLGDILSQCWIYYYLSSTVEENRPETMVFINKALVNLEFINDVDLISKIYLKASGYYLELGKLGETNFYLNKINQLDLSSLDLNTRVKYYRLKARYHDAKGNYQEAFNYMNYLHGMTKNKDEGILTHGEFATLKSESRYQQKEKEVEDLRRNLIHQGQKLDKEQRIRNLLIIIIVIALVLLIYAFISIRFIRKVNMKLRDKNKELELTNQRLFGSEKRLRELNATKDRVFSIIAHDLKNPFNALMGFSEILARRIDSYDKEQVKKYTSIMNNTANNIYMMLENLLEWSRTQRKKINLSFENFDIRTSAISVISLLELNAYRKHVDLHCKIPQKTYVHADKNTISTVLRNLIDNAIKFTSEGGKITIDAIDTNDMVEIQVSDTGIGIEKEDIDKLFKVETNFSSSGTSDEKGTGLGLILCKDFITLNKGEIWVESILNKGTTFHFTLPKPDENFIDEQS